VTAVLQAHYAWYNISPQGKNFSSVAFSTLSYSAEALIFSYLGIGVFSYAETDWSLSFIGIEFFIIVIGRFGSMFIVQYLFLCCTKQTLNVKEVAFLAYAGLIRGAIALGLALETQSYYSEPEAVTTSVLALVIITTLLFGSFMPLVAKCLLEKPAKLQIVKVDDVSRRPSANVVTRQSEKTVETEESGKSGKRDLAGG
jgi:solute carrier family 9 (sodium/hydrogen exchanger), member 6/7